MKVIAGCVYNDAVAMFISSYVATIAEIISTESFVHTHDKYFSVTYLYSNVNTLIHFLCLLGNMLECILKVYISQR